MINLLVPEAKKALKFARHNTALVRWIVIFGIVLAGTGVIIIAGSLYLETTINRYTKQIAASRAQLQAQDYEQVQKDAKAASDSLNLMVSVLSREVLFSELLTAMARAVPANVALTDLSIAQTQGGIDITAQATSFNAATQLQINLQDPANKIFQKADIVDLNCAAETNNRYPCTVNIRALFADNNPFLFINNKGTAR